MKELREMSDLASAPAPLDVEKVAREIADRQYETFGQALLVSEVAAILRKHLPSPEGKE